MNLFIKDPRSPEVLAVLKESGDVLLEVTTKQLYILPKGEPTPELMHDWFVHFRGRSHAYRDGSHIGGADEVVEVKNLTDGGKVIPFIPRPSPPPFVPASFPGYDKL